MPNTVRKHVDGILWVVVEHGSVPCMVGLVGRVGGEKRDDDDDAFVVWGKLCGRLASVLLVSGTVR